MSKVFISYSWEGEDHKDWVRHLADSLLENGIDATLDQYDLTLGDRLPQFMEQSITDADHVLVICTPTYKEKSDARKGGVGYEGHIISGELFSNGNERKFIPIIRKGTAQTAMPASLSGKLGIDLKNGPHYASNFSDLLTTLQGTKTKPPIQITRSTSKPTPDIAEDDPIHILGIITDQVTLPRMDGTYGSALYKIPFRLSRYPSEIWRELFVRNWNDPPKFTTMHRPGIASVAGDEIILDGTTIEEVRDYHRETLMLCVEKTNKEEQAILNERKRIEEQENLRKDRHYSQVKEIAGGISFD